VRIIFFQNRLDQDKLDRVSKEMRLYSIFYKVSGTASNYPNNTVA